MLSPLTRIFKPKTKLQKSGLSPRARDSKISAKIQYKKVWIIEDCYYMECSEELEFQSKHV